MPHELPKAYEPGAIETRWADYWIKEKLFSVPTPPAGETRPVFTLLLPPFLLLLEPLGAAWSRRHEFEADAYASAQSDAAALARALVKLYRENASTLTPDPLHSAFYDSHPPALSRIARLQISIKT